MANAHQSTTVASLVALIDPVGLIAAIGHIFSNEDIVAVNRSQLHSSGITDAGLECDRTGTAVGAIRTSPLHDSCIIKACIVTSLCRRSGGSAVAVLGDGNVDRSVIDLGRLHSQDVGISGACRIGTAICAGRSLNIKGHSVALICRQRTRVTYREAELHCAVLCQGAGSTDIVHIGQGGIPGSQSASVLPSHRHSGNIRITDVFDLYFHIDGCIVTVLNCLFPRVVSIPSGRTGLRRRLTQFRLQRQRLGIGGIVARICACHLEGEVIACRTSILLLEGGRSRSPVGHIQLSNILIAVTVHHLGTRHQPSGLDNSVTVIVGLGFVDNGFDLGLGFLDFQRHGHVRLLTGRSVRCCNRKCNRTHIVIDSGPRR